MANYQLLCWRDIPAQVKAEDASGEVQAELPARFQEEIDRVATKCGAIGTDDYLDGWGWTEPVEREGTAQEVLDAVVAELLAKHPEA